ncbi:O-acetyl-ADP-ribose deacetylase [Gottfriedia acidiceleris]|uniref:O-acetyl-ADP-ribose deacetylase n=1 Tax=Gottfriedia acidiceleris TaxID=371036 RepID=UPI003AF74609
MGIIKVVKGDITEQTVDAIVNAANSSLLGGGGVDGAIHRSAGKRLYDECVAIRNKKGGCKTGEAVITTGGNLSAKYVIHTVGPVWNGGDKNEKVLLKKCYLNSLDLARKNGIKTIAFPNISTGIYGYPKIPAAKIAVKTVNEYLENNEGIKEVIFVCFDEENYHIYTNIN